MSTAQILTVVGYTIGSFTPFGPALGAMIGSPVGGCLDCPEVPQQSTVASEIGGADQLVTSTGVEACRS